MNQTSPIIGAHRDPFNRAMNVAKQTLDDHRAETFRRTFGGTALIKKGKSIQEDASEVHEAATGFVKATMEAVGKEVPAVSATMEALTVVYKLAGIEEGERSDFDRLFSEELAVFVGKGLLGAAEQFVPYLGLVMGGKDMVREWVMTAERGHKVRTVGKGIGTDVLPGDPEAAARAVQQMMRREATNHGRLAVIHTVKFSVDVAVTAGAAGADVAGPVTGAAAAGAKLANTLFLLGRDYREMKAANHLLQSMSPPTAARLFASYPLLGAWLIAGSDDSDVLNFLIKDMGKPGWMEKVEKRKKQTVGPLQKEARRLIQDSRFTLQGFHGAKVDVQVAAKQGRMAQVTGFVNKLL